MEDDTLIDCGGMVVGGGGGGGDDGGSPPFELDIILYL